MIDFRHESFFVLGKVKSYTKAAQLLNLTQPAISQHIQFLEQFYHTKLVTYQNRTVELTDSGMKLFQYLTTILHDNKKFIEELTSAVSKPHIQFGATLTIGEYVMPSLISDLLNQYQFSMQISNTQNLLVKLQNGELDFLIVEGYFDKLNYDYQLFSKERFIGVCSPNSKLANQKVVLKDLFEYNLILREEGSGTRKIFTQFLQDNHYSINQFKNHTVIGNMNVIKQLVKDNLGISFLYEAAVKDELEQQTLIPIFIEEFNIIREFNFISLKDSKFKQENHNWFEYFFNKYQETKK